MLFSAEKIFEREQQRAFWSRWLRKIFLEDWMMKVIALLITFGLWLGITGLRTPTSTTIRNIPLEMRVGNDLEVTSLPVKEVDIKITGDKSKLNQLNRENLLVSLDLTEVQSGERVVSITPDNVNVELPAGIKLDSITPSIIPIKLERVIERDVPVKAETEGVVAEGYEIYSATANPPTVRVSGPESFIRPLDSVSTEKINVEGRQADFTAQQVSLNIVSPNIRPVDTTVVDVTFRVGERRIEKTFIVTAKTETGERRVPVTLYGARSVVENLSPENIKVEFTKSETGETATNITLPPEIQDKVEIRNPKGGSTTSISR